MRSLREKDNATFAANNQVNFTIVENAIFMCASSVWASIRRSFPRRWRWSKIPLTLPRKKPFTNLKKWRFSWPPLRFSDLMIFHDDSFLPMIHYIKFIRKSQPLYSLKSNNLVFTQTRSWLSEQKQVPMSIQEHRFFKMLKDLQN